jgi:hypothetical protein
MSATTTKLLSSGEFCKLRYDPLPIKSASANVAFYTTNSKMPNFELCDTLVANERHVVFSSTWVNPQNRSTKFGDKRKCALTLVWKLNFHIKIFFF